jgi:hypothetical protein
METTETVENVAHGRNIKMLANPGEAFLVAAK